MACWASQHDFPRQVPEGRAVLGQWSAADHQFDELSAGLLLKFCWAIISMHDAP